MHHSVNKYQDSVLPDRSYRAFFQARLNKWKALVVADGGTLLANCDEYYHSLPEIVKRYASVIMMPAYKTLTVYAITDTGDFRTFYYARTGPATFVNSSGLIQNGVSNRARFAWDYAGGKYLGLMWENSRTNYVLANQTPTVTALNGAIYSTTSAMPQVYTSGSVTGYYRTGQSSNNSMAAMMSTATYSSGIPFTVSACVRANTVGFASIGAVLSNGSAHVSFTLKVDLSNGSVTQDRADFTPTGYNYSVVKLANDWWRVMITILHYTANVPSGTVNIGVCDASNSAYSNAYVCLPQVTISGSVNQLPEIFDQSLISTGSGSSAVTNPSCLFTIDNNFINNGSCSVILRFRGGRFTNQSFTRILRIGVSGSSIVSVDPSFARFYLYDNNEEHYSFTSTQLFEAGKEYRSASTWGADGLGLTVNGSQEVNSLYNGVMGTDVLRFFGSTIATGYVRDVIIFNRQLSRAERVQLAAI